MKLYKGWRLYCATTNGDGEIESERHLASGVTVEVIEGNSSRPLPTCNSIRDHSPDGFNWGYGGSGPAQLALAICVDALGGVRGSNPVVYQEFKRDMIAHLPDDWEFDDIEVVSWFESFRDVMQQQGVQV